MEVDIVKKKVKNMTLRIKPDGAVVLTAPLRFADDKIQAFLAAKQDWIQKHVDKILQRKQEVVIPQGHLMLHGEIYRVQNDPDLKRDFVIDYREHIIRSGKDLLDPKQQTIWYKAYAREVFEERLNALAHEYNLSYKQLIIRDGKTRWGSCSSQKHISLSRRLIKMPDAVMDYVICHELAHLVHMNHSAAFWVQVEVFCPDYKQSIKWMKQYGFSVY